MKKTITLIASLMAMGSILLLSEFNNNSGYSYSSGIVGVSGAPGEQTCARSGCHTGFAVTPETGWITTNIPAGGYTGGQTYTITCTATYSASPRFGFNCSAMVGTGSTPAGTIVNTSTQTQVSSGEITHTSSGTAGSGTKSWSFNWIAPSSGTGAVTFYAAFNCSNGNSSSSGDHIMTSTLTVQEVAAGSDDAGISAVTSPAATICSTSFTPSVTLNNYGTNALTSATINFAIDGGTPTTYSWTGNLASSSNTNVSLPAQTVTAGSHTFLAYTTSPNGTTDGNNFNDTTKVTFYASASGAPVPFSEGFEGSSFPPTGWSINNPDNGDTWKKSSTAKTGTGSATIDNYNYQVQGEHDELISPPIDCSALDTINLSFDLAYTYYSGSTSYYDSLQVLVSNDCGQTFTSVFKDGGATLATAPGSGSEFTPTSSQWVTKSINLNSYAGSEIIVDFRNIGEYGNDIFLDNINISSMPAGVNNLTKNKSSVTFYPNPVHDAFTLRYKDGQNESVNISLYSIDGRKIEQLVSGMKSSGVHTQTINLKDKVAKGMYYLKIVQGDKTSMQKLIVQ